MYRHRTLQNDVKIQKKETDYGIYEKSFVFFAHKIELIRNEMNILELSERKSFDATNELLQCDPYPAAEYVTNQFKDEESRARLRAGRIMSRRVMGKASFIELQDSKGRIQVYITRDDICPGEDKELYNAYSNACSTW